MRLAEYLTANDIPNAAFADAIGVSVQALSRYRLGQRKPEWAILERIQRHTHGAVTPNDFLETTPADLARAPQPEGAEVAA